MAVNRGWTSDSGQYFSKEARNKSYELTKAAIESGEIPPASEIGCNRCGQMKGIIHYHNHDYSSPTEYLEALCKTCHMVLHSEHRVPELCKAYWDYIKEGGQLAPMYDNNLGAMWNRIKAISN